MKPHCMHSFCLSLDVPESVVSLNLHLRHACTHRAQGGLTMCIFRHTTRPTYSDSREWYCMPSLENCGGIDMLFIIFFCINYISQNGKEQRRNVKRSRDNLVCSVCLKSLTGFIFCSLSLTSH